MTTWYLNCYNVLDIYINIIITCTPAFFLQNTDVTYFFLSFVFIDLEVFDIYVCVCFQQKMADLARRKRTNGIVDMQQAVVNTFNNNTQGLETILKLATIVLPIDEIDRLHAEPRLEQTSQYGL